MAETTLPTPGGDSETWGTELNAHLNAKLNHYRSIKEFGAVGDGVADDGQAFTDFNTWAIAQTGTVHLIIPPGIYSYATTETPARWQSGIASLVVHGDGATLNFLKFGSVSGWPYSNLLHGLINTTAALATTVTLVTTADHSKFAVDDWVAIGALDMQGGGAYPQNLYYCEYRKITQINTGTGVITLNRALTYSYRSTYPVINAGDASNPFEGGPAAIFKLDDTWNTKIHLKGLNFSQNTDIFGQAREATWEDCSFELNNASPSAARRVTYIRCQFGGAQAIEVDKVVERLEFKECDAPHILTQSASVDLMVVDGCQLGKMTGTSKHAVIRNTSMPELFVGPSGYGSSESVVIENCVIGSVSASLSRRLAMSGFTVTDGTISFVKSGGSTKIVFWTPGAKVCVTDSAGLYNYYSFVVIGVREDGTNIYVDTTLPGTLPDPNSGDGTHFAVHPCQRITVRGSSGCARINDLSRAPADRPIWEYAHRFYTGYIATAEEIPIWGKLVSLRINVIRAYTGAQGTLTMKAVGGEFGNQCRTIDADGDTKLDYNPVINLKIAGERLIVPGTTTGTQSGDTGLDIGANWFCRRLIPYMATDISAEDRDLWPIFEIEIQTDQGFTAMDRLTVGSVVVP